MASTLATVSYCLCMGVCGIILVSIGVTLSDLAERIGSTSPQLGSVFIVRGVGAVAGSLLSAELYRIFPGNRVITVALAILALTCVLLPTNRTWVGIHFLFLLLGLGTAITDTGCQIMTRKLHGERAGPYLGLNTLAFGVSGSVVPLIAFLARDVSSRFAALTAIIIAVAFAVICAPEPSSAASAPASLSCPSADEESKSTTWHWSSSHNSEGTMGMITPRSSPASGTETAQIAPTRPATQEEPPHYYTEMAISALCFSVIGGQVSVTAYLESYVEQTRVIPPANKNQALLCFLIFVTLGRAFGIYLQSFNNAPLPTFVLTTAAVGSTAAVILLLFQHSIMVFWVALPLWGFCNGPLLGFSYDLNNRLTLPTEKSMSLVMFGLNLGASVVPYVSSLLWRSWFGPSILLYVIFLSLAIPIPLVLAATRLSYMDSLAAAPRRPTQYESINVDEETTTPRRPASKSGFLSVK